METITPITISPGQHLDLYVPDPDALDGAVATAHIRIEISLSENDEPVLTLEGHNRDLEGVVPGQYVITPIAQ